MPSPIEKAFGYTFKNPTLLSVALTHRSVQNAPNNERLEFLGDAILGAVAAEALFKEHPEFGEGELTEARTELVCGAALAKLAHELGLPDALKKAPATPLSERMLACTVEALIGAVILDGGFAKAQAVVTELIGKLRALGQTDSVNFKGALQELLQPDIPTEAIVYKCVAEDGPPHDRRYTVALFIGQTPVAGASGTASTKKAAENAAAALGLKLLESDRQLLKKITNSYPHGG